ncbi:hypothetical protein H072_8887 [Dactylellina haptotyla CBS 200.50]|uniref:ABC1 atypical kinase-like domain-containing protein n=1 Tax=Dactylellina haptotyla (strain CBS 200.50) TaxID=1284197 RepID=S8BDX7_DACHA|nr:hypothetical protein H072_8887 [Dactylellina haptotyla CBS 200.50]
MSPQCRALRPTLQPGLRRLNLTRTVIESQAGNLHSNIWSYLKFHRSQRRHQIGVGYGFDQPREFSPFVPPSPASLPPPRPPKQYPRLVKYGRRLLYLFAFGGTTYCVDRFFNYSAFIRSLRTFYAGLAITIDYKLNFTESKGDSIDELHLRSAERVFDILAKNGGLYLKVGQAVAMQAAVLPPAFQQKFAQLFDNAPQVSYKEVLRVFKQEFNGKTPDDIFMPGSFETEAIASASIAQVHRARLKDGTHVAVKIQKPQIATWIEWDLKSWSILMWLESKFFDINFYFVVPYIREKLKSECDFLTEAANSERTRAFVRAEPSLKNKVYIPQIYREYTTERILVAEWIDGVKLWDKEVIAGPWRGYDMVGKPIGRRRTQKQNKNMAREFTSLFETSPNVRHDTTVRRAGLGLSLTDVMTTIVRLFAFQMFSWGHVHCDPHPGNMFVRRKPNGKPEVVLIDHGLYVDITDDMRKNYCEFWVSLLTLDNKKIGEVAEKWGIGNADLFASATLMRPYTGGDNSFAKSITGEEDPNGPGGSYEMNQRVREGMKAFLSDTTKIPRELVFLGRSMRIIQGNNQLMGSPVNRIKETALAASRGLLSLQTGARGRISWAEKFTAYWRYALFRVVLFSSDIIFFAVRLRQLLRLGEGFEDELEMRMKAMAKQDFGIELNSSVFEG